MASPRTRRLMKIAVAPAARSLRNLRNLRNLRRWEAPPPTSRPAGQTARANAGCQLLERLAQESAGVRCCRDETVLGRLSRPLARSSGRRAGAGDGHPHLWRQRPDPAPLAAAAT